MAKTPKTHPIYAIAGPTASGKTALGVALALRVNGEVVNFDSVQIYQAIQIATAKPSDEEKRGIPHHLIDYVDPNVNYSAADWASDAAEKIMEIEGRGKTAVLVGGTGFYLRTLRKPLFDSPKTDPNLRQRLRLMHKNRGAEYLHRLLSRVDPKTADNLPPADFVRVNRALEVYFQTGAPISGQQHNREAPAEFASRIELFVLNPMRDLLYDRINRRTEEHFASGLVEEVADLRARGVRDDTNALGAHAYRRVCEHLRGERTLESAMEKSQQDVRNYAKRQLTWFRREHDAIWIDGFGDEAKVQNRFLQSLAEARP